MGYNDHPTDRKVPIMNALHNAKLTIAALVLYPFHFIRYFATRAYRTSRYRNEARKMRSTFHRPLSKYEVTKLKMRHDIFW